MDYLEEELLEVAWYLSKFGKKKPPKALGVEKFKDAIALFYPRYGAGKAFINFYNSLKTSVIALIRGSVILELGGVMKMIHHLGYRRLRVVLCIV